MASSDDFYALTRARLLGAQDTHSAKVAEAAEASNARRRAKVAAKARRCRAKWSPERKKAVSVHKMERAKELHGEDYFVKRGQEYRQSVKGMRYTKAYNASKGRENSRAYIERQKALDPEGWALKNRIRSREVHRRKKARALFMVLVNLPPLPSPEV